MNSVDEGAVLVKISPHGRASWGIKRGQTLLRCYEPDASLFALRYPLNDKRAVIAALACAAFTKDIPRRQQKNGPVPLHGPKGPVILIRAELFRARRRRCCCRHSCGRTGSQIHK